MSTLHPGAKKKQLREREKKLDSWDPTEVSKVFDVPSSACFHTHTKIPEYSVKENLFSFPVPTRRDRGRVAL
jgi:hypothetical protein